MEEHMFQGKIAALTQLAKPVEKWSRDWADCKFPKELLSLRALTIVPFHISVAANNGLQ